MTTMQSRRAFCSRALSASAAALSLVSSRHTYGESGPLPRSDLIPSHLPRKLTMSSWQWAWFTHSEPDAAYGNLERVMEELRERNFNSIRIDTALNWCFHADGSSRGEVPIRQTFPRHSYRLRIVNHRGGHRVDVLKQLINLMNLAKKYDIYVVLSDWEYMHTNWFTSDSQLRDEINSIPKEKRLLQLARQMDRLVRRLRDRGLEKQLAWIEPHNELDYSDFPKDDSSVRIHTEAIAYLRERHPDILVSANYGKSQTITTTENTQLYDHHIYAGSALYHDVWQQTIFHPEFSSENPKESKLLKQLLQEQITPYHEFAQYAPIVGESWTRRFWFYHNVNIEQFDRFIIQRYAEIKDTLKQNADKLYTMHAKEAARLKLPMVVTEGGFFYAPLNSRFEESEAGLDYFDHLTDLAVQHDLWAFVMTTYNGPEVPVWWACPKWLAENNDRFLKGIIKG